VILVKNKIYSYKDMVTMAFMASPMYTTFWILQDILFALLPVILVYVVSILIDTVFAIYDNAATTFSLYVIVVSLIILILLDRVRKTCLSLLETRRRIFFRSKLFPKIIEQYASLRYKYIENDTSLDMLKRISIMRFDIVIWKMFTNVTSMLYYVIYITSMIIFLSSYLWWLGLTVFISSIPLALISLKSGKKTYGVDRVTSELNRWADSFSQQINKREAFEERYLFETTDELNARYMRAYESERKQRLMANISWYAKSKAGGIVVVLYCLTTLLLLLPSVLDGTTSLGAYIAITGGLLSMATQLSYGVGWMLESMIYDKEYLNDLTDFMGMERQEGATDLPVHIDFDRMEFKDVSFKYPNTDKYVLSNCSFTIEKGKKYAFVGANGAGKSTLIKLITGLYDNYEGEILIDNKPLRDLSTSEIKGLASVVYQDFVRYSVSIRDNVTLPLSHEQHVALVDVLRLVGLNETIQNLPNGTDSQLGKLFNDGIDLSGGEWQRLAMARCVWNASVLKIFDEPTASLDPLAENEIYKKFEEIIEGKTAILISHRLASTKMVDSILVLDNGIIVELGHHTALMASKGLYYDMFISQSSWYNKVSKEK